MLTIENIQKTYNTNTVVLRDISLEIEHGEIVCLLGPSGCGKSTLLRIVAGLEETDQGSLQLDGHDLTAIPVHKRQFGLMFQEFALFPHRTVAENIAFGLRMAGKGRKEIAARVEEMLALVSLAGYADRSIFELSGGERQRVALARSLAPNPRLLMLDEPLGSLDRTLRDELMIELRVILKQVGATAIYVTHDQQEAFAIADRLVVMHQGRIEQADSPQAIYHAPANPFVANFLGLKNLIPVKITNAQSQHVETPFGLWQIPDHILPATRLSTDVQVLIRPEAVHALSPMAARPTTQSLEQLTLVGEIQLLSFRGASYHLELMVSPSDSEGIAQKKCYQLGFDLPATLVTPYLEQLEQESQIQLTLNSSGITLISSEA